MKKILLSVLVVTTIIVQLTFPSSAKDCPTISETIKVVTVKNSAVTLRTEPKYSNNNQGPAINEGEKLTVILPKPELGPDKENNTHCWYKVRPVNNSTQKEYWISEIAINEFPFDVKDTLSKSQSPASLSDKNQVSENQKKGKEETQDLATPSWLILALAGIGTLSSLGALAFTSLVFFSQQKKISSISDDIYEIKKNIQQLPNQILPKVSSQNSNALESYYKRARARIQGVSDQITEIKELNSLLLSQLPTISIPSTVHSSSTPIHHSICNNDTATSSQIYEPISIVKRELDESIQQFNAFNKDYFKDSRFSPLDLTKASSQGTSKGEDGNFVIQLEEIVDVSQSLFLQILLDGENWLIPNASSPYLGQILNKLEEYPEIFSIKSGTGKLTLIQPAKLKNIGSGLWEITDIGEFER